MSFQTSRVRVCIATAGTHRDRPADNRTPFASSTAVSRPRCRADGTTRTRFYTHTIRPNPNARFVLARARRPSTIRVETPKHRVCVDSPPPPYGVSRRRRIFRNRRAQNIRTNRNPHVKVRFDVILHLWVGYVLNETSKRFGVEKNRFFDEIRSSKFNMT